MDDFINKNGMSLEGKELIVYNFLEMQRLNEYDSSIVLNSEDISSYTKKLFSNYCRLNQ